MAKQPLKRSTTLSNSEHTIIADLFSRSLHGDVIERSRAIIKRNRNDSFAYKAMASSYLALGRISEACAAFDDALRLAPKDLEIKVNYAAALIETGEFERAIDQCQEALSLNPNYALAYSNLGLALIKSAQFDEGITAYEIALKLDPENLELIHNLGFAHLSAGKPGQAILYFQRATENNSNFFQAWMNLGSTLQLMGRFSEAQTAYQKVITLNPHDARPYTNLAVIENIKKNYLGALKYAKKSIQLDVKNPIAWGLIGHIFFRLRKIDEARLAFKEAISFDPNDGPSLLGLATLEEAENNFEEAARIADLAIAAPMERIKQGVTLAKDRQIEAMVFKSRLLMSMGRTEESVSLYRAACDELGRKHPHFLPYGSESQKPVVLLMPIGRAGSLFVHSLVDSHPEISTLPGIIAKGFFGQSVWPSLSPGYGISDWREQLSERFCRRFEPLFNASSTENVPGNLFGDATPAGIGSGLTTLGPNRDIVLRVDENVFKSHLNSLMLPFEEMTAPLFFRLIHQAWDRSIGVEARDKSIFFHIHNPEDTELAACLTGNPNAKLLYLVREPLQALESWMRIAFSDENTISALLLGYNEAINRVESMLRSVSHPANLIKMTAAIRLEDIKRHPNIALPQLASWMLISDSDTLRTSTFAGLEYDAPSSTPVKGFETTNLDRPSGFFFSGHDQRIFNTILNPIAVKYGYKERDDHHLTQEIDWCEANIEKPLDFEIIIQKQLIALGYKGEIHALNKRLRTVIQRSLALMKQQKTYPAMAPWLKIEVAS